MGAPHLLVLSQKVCWRDVCDTQATRRLLKFAKAAVAARGDDAGWAAGLPAVMLEEAQRLAEQDVAINKRIGEYGATVVKQGANILHHCNTGALATVDIGTAIGVIYGTSWAPCCQGDVVARLHW